MTPPGQPRPTSPPAPARGPAPRTIAAFTLLEVLIVIGMAAMVMAISIPFVKHTIRRDAVYRAVHVVEDACHNARALAILNNASAELVIRPLEKQFRVQPGSRSLARPVPVSRDTLDEDPEAPPRSRNPMREAPKPFAGQLDEDVGIEMLDVNFTDLRDAEEARVRFHPNGTSDEFTIVMRIGNTAWRKITLDLMTATPTLEVLR